MNTMRCLPVPVRGSWEIFGTRKVMSLGTGQRNLAAALLVAAHSFSADTFVMTVVACLVLTITMHLIAAEWGRLSGAD